MPIDLNQNTVLSSGITANGEYLHRIVKSGLVLNLDAGDLNSYPGSGSIWYDLSGNGHNFSFGANIAWNSAGYFNCTGGGFTGPASNLSTWNFNTNCEHHIEIYCDMTSFQSNKTFWFEASSVSADNRAIASHLGYGASGLSYYDVGGCCATSQRISGNISNLTGTINCISFQTRYDTFPNRRIYKNLIGVLDSGTYGSPPTVVWNDITPVVLFSTWLGKAYLIRVYNRPLHPYEMAENFQATRGRFGL